MRVFDSNQGWGPKVNFVDDENRLVGYDMGSCCCEYADWFIDDEPRLDGTYPNDELLKQKQPKEMPGFNFDPDYFETREGGDFDGGGVAVFRLVRGEEQAFLHVFNAHNGYYGHGFTFSVGDQGIREGYL